MKDKIQQAIETLEEEYQDCREEALLDPATNGYCNGIRYGQSLLQSILNDNEPKTNFDRITQSPEMLATVLSEAAHASDYEDGDYDPAILAWLNQESEQPSGD